MIAYDNMHYIPALLTAWIVHRMSHRRSLFRKGSLRANAKPRITDSPSVRPFVCVCLDQNSYMFSGKSSVDTLPIPCIYRVTASLLIDLVMALKAVKI